MMTAAEVVTNEPAPTALVHLGEVGLTLTKGLPQESWEDYCTKVSRIEKNIRWALGELMAFGEQEYGEKISYERASEITGHSVKDLRNMATVSRAFRDSRQREPDLSWSHHQEVVPLKSAAEQGRWLKKAKAENWTVPQFREQLRLTRATDATSNESSAKSTADPEPIPHSAPKCRRCGHPCRFCEVDILSAKKKAKKSAPKKAAVTKKIKKSAKAKTK